MLNKKGFIGWIIVFIIIISLIVSSGLIYLNISKSGVSISTTNESQNQTSNVLPTNSTNQTKSIVENISIKPIKNTTQEAEPLKLSNPSVSGSV